jgi:hypothetical protein
MIIGLCEEKEERGREGGREKEVSMQKGDGKDAHVCLPHTQNPHSLFPLLPPLPNVKLTW